MRGKTSFGNDCPKQDPDSPEVLRPHGDRDGGQGDRRDGDAAVRLAFGACKEKSLTKPELGHLKKADASAHRHLVEFRDEAGELLVGETVTVDAFSPGDQVKVSGRTKGKGFQGTIKRHNFASGPKSHGSHNVRA